jgi:chromate reductase
LDVQTLGKPETFIQAKEGLSDRAGNLGSSSNECLRHSMGRDVAWVRRLAS